MMTMTTTTVCGIFIKFSSVLLKINDHVGKKFKQLLPCHEQDICVTYKQNILVRNLVFESVSDGSVIILFISIGRLFI